VVLAGFVSEFPGPATKPKHAGGRPRGSRDKVRRKPRGLASPPESNNGGELFFRAPEPVYEVERERGWHTLAAHLYATGATGTQLAREFGKDTDTVYNLLRQPWFIERVNQIVAERGADAMELLRGAQTTAIQTMIAILNDPQVPARVRLMAADSIIDRVAGKATQRIEAVGVAPSSDPVAEVEQLERELEGQLAREGWVRVSKLPPHEEESQPRDGDESITDADITPEPRIPLHDEELSSPPPRPVPPHGMQASRRVVVPPRREDSGDCDFPTYYG
jgi:hypothetical protein